MIDLGGYMLEADERSVTLHRKVTRTNKTTNEQTPGTEVVGHYATFGQAAHRLAHMSAAEAVRAGHDVDDIATAVADGAARIERAIEGVA
jgi:hypothetical protein